MIRIDRTPPPVDLDGDQSPGALEREEWARYINNKVPPKPEFKAYKSISVKEALNDLFHHKCAYCESDIDAVAPDDIEHWRPKGSVKCEDGTTVLENGYWWLAADWENLFVSCIKCNRRNTLKIAGQSGFHTIGKGCFFPLSNEEHRAKNPGEEQFEKPLLLNPCTDDPEKHMFCNEDGEKTGLLQPTIGDNGLPDEKGDKSISIFGLNRSGLVVKRIELIKQIELIRDDIEYFIQLKAILPHGNMADKNNTKLEERMNALNEYLLESKEYLLLARQLINRFINGIIG